MQSQIENEQELGKVKFPDSDLPLQRIYSSERNRPDQPFLTQPRNGEVQNWTWAEAMHEIRRIAGWLMDQNLPAGSRVVILSKNCAWWIMADIAIWMSGHISVPFFPSLRDESLASLFRHSEPVACFLGELDQCPPFDVTSLQNMKFVRFPNAKPDHIPQNYEEWQTIVEHGTAFAGQSLRAAEDIATIIYTSGTTGQPKGVMQSFRSLSLMGKSMEPVLGNSPYALDRILSYLPLAHIAERAIVEMNSLIMPLQIFFTEGHPTFLTDLQRHNVRFSFQFLAFISAFSRVSSKRCRSRSLTACSKFPSSTALLEARSSRD